MAWGADADALLVAAVAVVFVVAAACVIAVECVVAKAAWVAASGGPGPRLSGGSGAGSVGTDVDVGAAALPPTSCAKEAVKGTKSCVPDAPGRVMVSHKATNTDKTSGLEAVS